MSFLVSLLADIAIMVLKSLGLDIADYIKKKEEQKLSQIANGATEDASVAKLKSATTGDEIENAAKDAFDKT